MTPDYIVNIMPPRERRAALAISCMETGMASSGPELLGRKCTLALRGTSHTDLHVREEYCSFIEKASERGVANFVGGEPTIKGSGCSRSIG